MPDTPSDMIGLARPNSELQKISVTEEPTAGQGFSLNPQGHIPIVAKDGQWTMEYVTVGVDLASTAAQSNSSNQVAIPGLVIGDLAFYIGVNSVTATTFIHQTIPVCSIEGEITMRSFNADNITVDPDSTLFHFLVIHRFL